MFELSWILYAAAGVAVIPILMYMWFITMAFILSGGPVYDINGKKLPGPSASDYYLNFGGLLKMMVKSRIAQQKSEGYLKALNEVGDGNMCAVTLNGENVVFLGNPELIKVVLSGHYSKFNKAPLYDRMKFALGEGLVTSNGAKWQHHRHQLNIAFQAEALRGMAKDFNHFGAKMVGIWIERAKSSTTCAPAPSSSTASDRATTPPPLQDVHLNRDITYLTLCIICKTGFGFELPLRADMGTDDATSDADVDESHLKLYQRRASYRLFMTGVDELNAEINRRVPEPTDWWHRLYIQRTAKVNAMMAQVHGLIDSIVTDRQEQRVQLEGDAPTHRDLLDLVLDAGGAGGAEAGAGAGAGGKDSGGKAQQEPWTAVDIRDHVLTFLAAGHETTSSTLLWLLLELGRPGHEHFQRACQLEIDALLGSLPVTEKNKNSNSGTGVEQQPEAAEAGEEGNGADALNLHLDFATLSRLHYCTAVVKETMRYHAAVGGLGKVCSVPVQLGPEYTVPAGTVFVISVKAAHRHPDFWDSPDEFNPDRFLPESLRGRYTSSDFSSADASETLHEIAGTQLSPPPLKHPFMYIPFSAGPRNCIGQRFAMMEVLTLLTYILHYFTVSMSDAQVSAVRFEESVTHAPKRMQCTLTPRREATWGR